MKDGEGLTLSQNRTQVPEFMVEEFSQLPVASTHIIPVEDYSTV